MDKNEENQCVKIRAKSELQQQRDTARFSRGSVWAAGSVRVVRNLREHCPELTESGMYCLKGEKAGLLLWR